MKTCTFIDNEEQMENHTKIKTMVVTIELYENMQCDEMENIIGYMLNAEHIDCIVNVKEI